MSALSLSDSDCHSVTVQVQCKNDNLIKPMSLAMTTSLSSLGSSLP